MRAVTPFWPPEAEVAAPTTMSSWPPVHASGTAALGEGLGVAAGLAEGVGVGVGAVVLVVGTDGATGLAEIVGGRPMPGARATGELQEDEGRAPPTRRTATSTMATTFHRIGLGNHKSGACAALSYGRGAGPPWGRSGRCLERLRVGLRARRYQCR